MARLCRCRAMLLCIVLQTLPTCWSLLGDRLPGSCFPLPAASVPLTAPRVCRVRCLTAVLCILRVLLCSLVRSTWLLLALPWMLNLLPPKG